MTLVVINIIFSLTTHTMQQVTTKDKCAYDKYYCKHEVKKVLKLLQFVF
jgi:hypothetical protein